MVNAKDEYYSGIKGIAALVVVIFHFLSAVYPPLINGQSAIRPESELLLKIAASPLNIVYDGNLAVAFFFIMSGYGLSYRFFKSGKKLAFITLVKRYIRLTPQIFISVMAIYFLLKHGCIYSRALSEITGSGWLAQFYQFEYRISDALAEAVYGSLIFGRCNYNPTLWTMQYLFWGVFFVAGMTSFLEQLSGRNRCVVYLVCALLLYNSYYLAFLAGMTLCDLKINYKGEFIKKYWGGGY